MNYGLYLSAGGALTSMYRLDVLANNLANVNTPAFKPDTVNVRQRLPERIEAGLAADPREMLERLGGTVHANPSRPSLEQGPLNETGRPLDLALEGEGLLVVGREGDDAATRLTRDGRLTLGDGGRLRSAATGLELLDAEGRAIRIDPERPVVVDAGGAVKQDGTTVGRLRIVAEPDPLDLVKTGSNAYRMAENAAMPAGEGDAIVRQGYVEGSAVDPIMALNSMIAAQKAASSNLKMMQYHDYLMGQAISRFARVG